MSSDLSIDSFDDSLSEFYPAPSFLRNAWHDHTVTWKGFPELRSSTEHTICEAYDSDDDRLTHQLATLYFEQIYPRHEVQRTELSKPSIYDSGLPINLFFKEKYDRLILEHKQILYQAGMIKDEPPPLEPISPTNFPTLWAWQTYCLENGISLSPPKTHSGGFKEFWIEHKKEIIIAAVVIAVAVGVAVVIVTTAGAGTNVAVATGTAAVQAAIDGFSSSEDSDSNVQGLQCEPKIDERIQNFAKAIGATDISNANGSIVIIETSSIASEITPEILTDLATNWNTHLISAQAASVSQSTLHLLPTNERLDSSDPQPTSLLPWVNEGISYLQWKEKKYCEQLFKELENRSQAPENNNKASIQSASDDVPLKVINLSEWDGLPQEPRPRFSDRIVEDFLKDREEVSKSSIKDNYASKADHFFDGFQSPPPYQKMDLIGNFKQSTVHYHCGIGNGISDIAEGGSCLYKTLNEEFAIQSHLIHSDSVGEGLGFVFFEQIEKNQAHVRELQQEFVFRENDTLNFPKVILDCSIIKKSIDFEVENLSKIAQNIIEQGNPNLKQLHVTFSNGGYIFNEALKQLPSEYQETIIVITTGTTAIIDRGLAHKTHNIIGDKDRGSQICNGRLNGIEIRKEKANIDVICQTETQKWIQGHYFMQPDYQENISEYLKREIINRYEIY